MPGIYAGGSGIRRHPGGCGPAAAGKGAGAGVRLMVWAVSHAAADHAGGGARRLREKVEEAIIKQRKSRLHKAGGFLLRYILAQDGAGAAFVRRT